MTPRPCGPWSAIWWTGPGQGARAGWPGEWREVVDDLRRSPHIDVRRRALDIRPDA